MKSAMLNSRAKRAFGIFVLGLSICLVAAVGSAQERETKKDYSSPGALQKRGSGKAMVPGSPGVMTPGPRQQEKDPNTEVHIYPARFASAQELAAVVTQVFPQDPNTGRSPVRAMVDERTNRLVLSTYPAVWPEVEALLQKLDTASEEAKDAMKLETFTLEGLGDDQALLQNALTMILNNNTKAKYALDARGHALLVYGDERTIAEVRVLCNLLRETATSAKKKGVTKVTPAEEPNRPLQIRLLWLVDAPKGSEGEPLSGEVLKIKPVLDKLSIKNPRIISNCLVSTMTNLHVPFQCSGNSSLGPISMSGTCHLSGNMAKMSLALKVGGESPHPNLPSAHIETAVQTPLDHFLLLGMTPTTHSTFVFVLQVTQPD